MNARQTLAHRICDHIVSASYGSVETNMFGCACSHCAGRYLGWRGQMSSGVFQEVADRLPPAWMDPAKGTVLAAARRIR
jgi:hypothetical protein